MPNALRKEPNPTFLNDYASIVGAGTDGPHQAGSSPSVIQRSNVIVTQRRGHGHIHDGEGVVLGHCESMPIAGDGGAVPLPVPVPPIRPGSNAGMASLKTDSSRERRGIITEDPSKSSKVKKTVTPFVCEYCSRSFRHQSYFTYHLRTHTGERPHKCSICDQGFFERSKLNRHLNSCHSIRNPFYGDEGEGEGRPPFKCDICEKTFARNCGLQAHLLVHQGSRPYLCTACGKRFSGLTALKKHEKGHQRAKDIPCEICGEAFLLKKYLDLHMSSTHKQQKRDHKCPRCGKGFHLAKDLRRHQLIHTKERNFKCRICSTTFKRKDNLSRHLRLSHDLPPEQNDRDVPSGGNGGVATSMAETVIENNTSNIHPPVVGYPGSESEPIIIPPVVPITRQVSVIKSTHEFMLSMSKGSRSGLN